jgi:hypothetical protein
MHEYAVSQTEVEIDADMLGLALERRLRDRAARADSAVEITPETLNRWAQEELHQLVVEFAEAHVLAHARVLN